MITRRINPDEVSDFFANLKGRILRDDRYAGERGNEIAEKLDALRTEIVAAADHGHRRSGAPCL